MSIDFYYSLVSPPCRSVLMLGKILGIEFNLKPLNVMEKKHLTPEFLKVNPEHTVPTIVDNGVSVWESRAILSYLAEKYGKGSDLYPNDVVKRSKINQKLYFDTILSEKIHVYYNLIKTNQAASNPDALKKIEDSLSFLDAALESQKYVTGDKLTIADLPLFVSLSTCKLVGAIDFTKFPNVTRWINDFKTVPGYEINENGLTETKKFIEALKLKK